MLHLRRHDHQVAVLVYDGLSTFEFGIVADVFGQPCSQQAQNWYRLVSCAVEPGPLHASGGISVTPQAGLEQLAIADTIVVPGWRRHGRPPTAALADALKAAAERGARIISICSGAFLLAELGLLDGKRATTHWKYIEEFKAAYPRLQLVPEVLYVDEGQILTSAGSAAGIDLLLHIVRSDFGSETANRVARGLVVPAHRDGGQAQFIERPVPRRPNGRLAPLLDQMRRRLDRPQSNSELAREAAMSERTFLRRFREITGTTPARWLHEERIAVAKQLLEESKAPMEEIAAVTGYGTGATMRVQFRKRVGIAPSEYRRRFGGKSAGLLTASGEERFDRFAALVAAGE